MDLKIIMDNTHERKKLRGFGTAPKLRAPYHDGAGKGREKRGSLLWLRSTQGPGDCFCSAGYGSRYVGMEAVSAAGRR